MRNSVQFTLIILFVSIDFLTVAEEIVELSTGLIKGYPIRDNSTNDIIAWAHLGIPYAEAPIGDFRFEKPRPKEPWEGELIFFRSNLYTQTPLKIWI